MIKKNEALHGAIVRLNDPIQGNHVGYPGKLYLSNGPTGYLCEPGDDLEIVHGVGKFHLNWLICFMRPLKDPSVIDLVNWNTIAKTVDLIHAGQKLVSPWIGHTATKPADIGGGITAAGLHITKNGRLKYPLKGVYENIPLGHTAYLHPHPKVGDLVCYTTNRMLSAGTVGKILKEDPHCDIHDGSYQMQMLDGSIQRGWRYGTGLMTEAQVQEVVDFYLADGRPERVFVKF